ncbi:MAG: sugar ABC transporter substrate-binding protein [Candidatus Nanopelagicales bacterium]
MRIRHGVAAGLALTLTLGACSSTTDDSPSDGAESASAPSGTTVDLRWRTRPDNQAEADVYAGISEAINAKNIGLNLTYEAGNSEGSPYQDKLKTELSAGTAPDVFWIPGTDVADFAKADLILNANEVASAAGFDPAEFYAGPMDQLLVDPATGVKGDGFVWGVPRDVSTFALYLNLDLIDEAGVDDPRQLVADGQWNWDAFEATAEAITDLGSGVKGFGANSWWANWGYFVNSAGGSFFNEDRTACNLDSPESINGIEYLQGLYAKDYGVAFGEDAEPVYKSGKLGMFINGRWATPGAREISDFNWDVAPLPTGAAPGNNWQFWGAYVINANTADPAAAWKLVTELTSLEVQNEVAALGANIPSRTSQEAIDQFLTYTPPANNQAFVDGIQNDPVAEGPLWKGNWPAFDKASADEVTALMNGTITIDEYQESICKVTASAFE